MNRPSRTRLAGATALVGAALLTVSLTALVAPGGDTAAAATTCTGPAWSATTAYTGGTVVTYGGHTWTAKWWTQGDTPGGAAGVWTDNGAC